MEYLEENNCLTSIRNMRIVIFEKDKAKEFQEEWDNLFKERYGDDIDSEKEVSGEEDSASDDDVKPKSTIKATDKPAASKKKAQRLDPSDSSEEEVKQVKKSSKKDKKKTGVAPKRQLSSSSESDDTIATGVGKAAVGKSKVSVKNTGVAKATSKKKAPVSDSSSDSDSAPVVKKSVKATQK